MAHLLGTQNVGVTLGARSILSDINVSLQDGDRIGVIGPNGGGKSTLLRILDGTLEPDTGEVTRNRDVRIAALTQADTLDPNTDVEHAIHGDSATFEWASDSAVRALHDGLLPDIPLTARVGELSGGQRRRVSLARVLTQDANVVLLDEPTNHLDMEGIAFLASYLNERFGGRGGSGGRNGAGALVAVTHDRWFLDAVATHLWEVVPAADKPGRRQVPGHVESYTGGYSDYTFQRVERARQAAVVEQKRQNLMRKELAWLRRGAPARTSKPRFHVEEAEALIADVPPMRDTMELTRMATARLGKQVVDLEDVSFAYPDGQPVLEHVTLRLAPGQRLGILGPNGAGKSTLLGLIAGHLEPTSGRVRCGKTVKLAELSQNVSELDAVAQRRVVEAVSDVAQYIDMGRDSLSAMQLTERMGFTRERAWTPVADISGGERRRLQLMRLLMAEPNVLLLDEPTNDLDTDTLAAMEDLLDGWPGTLVVVSHDRYLLDRMTDGQVAVVGTTVRDLPGGVEEYLRLRRDAAARTREAGPGSEGLRGDGTGENGAGGLTGAEAHAAHKELGAIERKIEKAKAEVERIKASMADTDPTDYQTLTELGRDMNAAQDRAGELEERWLELAEKLEG